MPLLYSKFWVLAFLTKTSQKFISDFEIHHILGWNIYHLLNNDVGGY